MHEYLEWELSLLFRRLDCVAAGRRDELDAGAYRQALAALDDERARGLEKRANPEGRGIPLVVLAQRYGLDPSEEQLLVLAAVEDLSAPVHQLLLHIQTASGKRGLDVDLATEALWPQEALGSALGPFRREAPLVAHGLLLVEPPPDGAPGGLLSYRCRTPHHVARFLSDGALALDDDLAGVASLSADRMAPTAYVVDRELLEKLETLVTGLSGLQRGRGVGIVALSGPEGVGRDRIARAVAARLERPLLTLNTTRLRSLELAASLVPLAASNARFADAVLHVVGVDEAVGRLPGLDCLVAAALDGPPLPVLLDRSASASPSPALDGVVAITLPLRRPDRLARLELWEDSLPPDVDISPDVDLQVLSDTYRLSALEIGRAALWAQQVAMVGGRAVTHEDLDASAALQLEGAGAETLTTARQQRLSLRDVVLDEKARERVLELRSACLHRSTVLTRWGLGRRLSTGRGIVALFAGEAGTGKTLTAEVLANELGLELRVVAVPSVVSKWVGETEKHIRELFAKAQSRRALLLFDEADSLFTKRVKVERAQDHFQNMEVNTLLQEVERFDGLVILTTNLETNIDKAFQRRILFRIEFRAPDADQRLRIWQTLMPPDAPVDPSLDLGVVARDFELTGGQIRNAIIQASYACCAAGEPLNLGALEKASRAQAEAAGKLVRLRRDELPSS